MRRIAFFSYVILLSGLLVTTFGNAATPKESVTIEINADLLKRARAQDLDLASILEKQLKAKLGGPADATPTSYLPFLTATFDNLEAMMFAPINITTKTPTAEVRAVCQAINKNMDQLVADAEARKAMPLPTSLEEAKELDEFIQSRFQAFQTRLNTVGNKMQTSGKIMEAKCADLEQDHNLAQEAMKTVFAGYGPAGWCQAMRRKPQAEWTMNDSGKFMKFCTGTK